jgi:hypothetical protein
LVHRQLNPFPSCFPPLVGVSPAADERDFDADGALACASPLRPVALLKKGVPRLIGEIGRF